MSNPGFRIRLEFARVPAEICRRAAGLPTSTVADFQNRLGVARGIWPAAPGRCAAGPAFTVRVAPGDNLLVHKAVDAAQPGDVIVIDTCGCESHAVFGDLLARHTMRRGVAAVVIDGYVRDVAGIRGLELPVFARGACPAGPYKNGPGEIGFPIQCGGVAVQPGDLVVADDDGVVFVPRAEAEAVVAQAAAAAAKEPGVVAAIDAGRWDRAWVDEALRAKGCEGIAGAAAGGPSGAGVPKDPV